MIGKTRTTSSNNTIDNSKKIKKAILCGSFNPFHEGHLFLLNKALKKFDFIYIIIAQNPNKQETNKKQIYEQIKIILKQNNLDCKTQILVNEGLLANFIKTLDTTHIVRGFRNWTDFWYEQKLKQNYLKVNPKIKFHLYRSDLKHQNIRNTKN